MKKQLGLTRAAAAFAAAGLFATAAGAALTGDLNSDGRRSAEDAFVLRDILLGKGNLSAEADVSGDGKVNAGDLSLLKQQILNPEPEQPEQPEQPQSGIPDLGTAPDTSADLFADFRTGDPADFFASDGWTNGDPFDCWWYARNTALEDGCLKLSIDRDWEGKAHYSGAEYRTNGYYGYGYYETSMQAIKNDGVVSSFFTYTGPSDNNPWDEIDIEILGKDTTKVQLNYYTNGVGNHEFMYDLGFDSSEAYHTYGFDWQPDHIAWFVDGKEVYRATQNIPNTKGKIMMNTWPGIGVDDWLKHYDGNTPLTARYQWVTFKSSDSSSGNQGDNNNNNNNGDNNNNNDNNNDNNNNDNNNQNNTTPSGFVDYGTKMNANATMVSNFSAGDAGDFFASDGWTNGDPFDCWWYARNTVIKDGCLQLSIDRDWEGKAHYSGAEYRTNDFYGFGYYETSMQAIKNDGVVSSFFTYTGPSDNNPWDEIDIEILGKDTTKVQLNYYTNGVGNHEFMYDLGFDASQGFHTYGFDWQRDHITWYVDGKPVYTAYDNIPTTKGKIMMNTWPGIGVNEWLNPYNGNTPLTARYQWVTYNQQ